MKSHSLPRFLLLLIPLIASPATGRADLEVSKAGDSLVDAAALTVRGPYGPIINGLAFQQDAVVTHKGWQYVTYYDAERRVCLARRTLSAGQWEIVRFTDYDFKSHDAHNTISMGICPKDGTIHLAFDHHGHPLHYRVSRKNAATRPEAVDWDASLFGPVVSELEKGKRVAGLTYPRFWQTPGGGLQFCYRRGGSGAGDRMLLDYDAETGTWRHTRQIDSGKGWFKDDFNRSPSRCSYPNGYDYGPLGKLHVTWTWRERTQGANHDIMYAYSEDQGKTWLNNHGKVLHDPPHIGSPGINVVAIRRAYGLMNTQAQAVDSRGRIHVVMWHCTDETLEAAETKAKDCWGPPDARRYHHYWRDKNAAWHHVEIPGVAGTRPKLFMDKENNAYLIYNAKRQSDKWIRNIMLSEGDLVIAAATAASEWKDWKGVHVEKGPFLNEMLGDVYRWKSDGVLSVMVQESTDRAGNPSPLRIIDFAVKGNRQRTR